MAFVCVYDFDAWTEIAKGIHLMEQFEISWWHIPTTGISGPLKHEHGEELLNDFEPFLAIYLLSETNESRRLQMVNRENERKRQKKYN